MGRGLIVAAMWGLSYMIDDTMSRTNSMAINVGISYNHQLRYGVHLTICKWTAVLRLLSILIGSTRTDT